MFSTSYYILLLFLPLLSPRGHRALATRRLVALALPRTGEFSTGTQTQSQMKTQKALCLGHI